MKLKKNLIIIIIILFSFLYMQNSFSVEPSEMLENKEQELRARDISKNVRCMICQNQSIDESNAPLAKDLRILIRNKIKDGKNDKEIYDFLTDRYGDFILLKPPFNLNTLMLWLSPFLFILVGIYIVYFHNKKSRYHIIDVRPIFQ